MRRVVVLGTGGRGKSVFAAALAGRAGLPVTHLGVLFHRAGWSPGSVTDAVAALATVVRSDSWVLDDMSRLTRASPPGASRSTASTPDRTTPGTPTRPTGSPDRPSPRRRLVGIQLLTYPGRALGRGGRTACRGR